MNERAGSSIRMLPIAIGIVLVVLALGVIAFFWLRSASSEFHWSIEIVQKSSEPPSLEQMKQAVKAAWGVEPASTPSAEVAITTAPSDDGTTVRFMVKCREFGYGVSYDPKPFPFPEGQASDTLEPKTREILAQNKAFWEIDILQPSGKPTEDCEKNVAQLIKTLVDKNTISIMSSTYQTFNPLTSEVSEVLTGSDPRKAFTEQIFMPMTKVSAQQAGQIKELAQKSLPEFVTAFEKKGPEDSNYCVKCKIEDSHGVEHIWLSVCAIEGETMEGEIGNETQIATSYHLGQKLSIKSSDVEDWMYLHGKTMMGGFHYKQRQGSPK